MKHFPVTPIILLVAMAINIQEHLSTDVLDNPSGSHTADFQAKALSCFARSGEGPGLEGSATLERQTFQGEARSLQRPTLTTPEDHINVTDAPEAH